jgi:hypothetical protein
MLSHGHLKMDLAVSAPTPVQVKSYLIFAIYGFQTLWEEQGCNPWPLKTIFLELQMAAEDDKLQDVSRSILPAC